MKDLFEGVYLKHQKNGESICFIAGRAGETRFVQVITNGSVRQYDGAQGFCFGEEGVAAELPGVQGAVRYGPLSPLRTDIMGPFRFLPMQCSHSVYSMAHTDTLRATGAAPFHGTTCGYSATILRSRAA